MEFYKKWWFWLIVIIILVAMFFYPKTCGGGGNVPPGPIYSTKCNCLGFLGSSPLNKYTTDASFKVCYGICLESSCKTTISYPNGTTIVR